MDEERLGIYRNSMDENPLLLKPELGKPLKRCFALPNDEFTYGRPNLPLDGGAAEAMTIREPIRQIRKKEKAKERDFIALNKGAVATGLVTAKEQFQYRATHDVRRRVSDDEKINVMTRRIPPDVTFGISTRPSTPVFDLLEHKYQEKWLTRRREAEMAKRARSFQQISAHLETFRSPGERDIAFKHHQTDATARTGVFGHGIYEAAKS